MAACGTFLAACRTILGYLGLLWVPKFRRKQEKSKNKSQLISLSSGTHRARGSPTAVVCSRELVSCGDGGTLCCSWVDTRGHVSSVCTFDLFACAPFSVSCVFRRESVVFPWRILISLGFSNLPRAPAPLCDHGLYHGWCLTTVIVRKQQQQQQQPVICCEASRIVRKHFHFDKGFVKNMYEILPRRRDLGDDKVSSPGFLT